MRRPPRKNRLRPFLEKTFIDQDFPGGRDARPLGSAADASMPFPDAAAIYWVPFRYAII
jgi:hypothetical protein